MKKRIGIQGSLMFAALLLGIIFPRLLIPSSKQPLNDLLWDVWGFVLILLGFFIRILARGYKSEMSLQGRTLIKDGLYSLVRNPMYLGTLIIGLGVTMVLFTWWVFIIFLAVFLLIYLPQIHREERYLLQGFGQEYENYCKATPRFLPKISGIFRISNESLFCKRGWVKKEANSLIAILAVVLFIEGWEDTKSFGIHQFIKELLALILYVGFLGSIISYYVKRGISKKF
jgi:protein-S-isoprenylcysteine O-methyltransferase Ste14